MMWPHGRKEFLEVFTWFYVSGLVGGFPVSGIGRG